MPKFSLTTVLTIFISIIMITISYMLIIQKIDTFENNVIKIKENHNELIRQILKKEISSAVEFINFKKETTEKRLKDDLKFMVDYASNISNNIYKNYKHELEDEEIINIIKVALRDIRFFDNRGYYFINTVKGKSILHPIFPELENTRMNEKFINKFGENILIQINSVFKKGNSGYLKYYFYETNKQEQALKIGYVKKLDYFDLYIGTAEYLSSYENKIKKEIFERLSKVRFGKDGYLFIDSYDGRILMHPMKPEIVGKNLITYKDVNGIPVIKNLIEAAKTKNGDFVYYNWHRPDSISNELNKVSFAMGVQDWQWMIGGGLYLDDINEELQKKEEAFEKEILQDILLTITIVSIFNILVILVLYWLKRLNKELEIKVDAQIQEIKESKEKFETIFNTIQDGIAIIDKNLNFIVCNDGIHKILEISNHEIYSKSLIDFFNNSEKDNFIDVIKKAYEIGYYNNYESHIIINKKQLSILINFVIMKDTSNLLIVLKDITETRIQERKLLEQSRLAQMGEMINMIAHQWRQPLGALSSAIVSIQNKLFLNTYDLHKKDDQDKFREFFNKKVSNIEQYIEFLSITIDEFKDFYKQDKEKTTVILSDIIRETLKIVHSSLIHKNIQINTKFENENEIKVFKNELMQVVLNIIRNSEENFILKEKIGEITIETSFRNNFSIISIRDNGGGISNDIIDHIFKPYFSTKEEKNGTGIGLYMSKLIIETHHEGQLLVENTKDGVEFTIKIK